MAALSNGRALALIEPGDLGRRTAHEFVRETLRSAILRGDLGGGARLIQADIAERLDVSTTPVREALRDLATEGLITLDRHRGGVVRELNWDDMQEIVAVRRQLEPLAVREAMQHVTEEELARAEAFAEQMTDLSKPGQWVEMNHRFHFVFHDATRSMRLAAILKGLQDAAGMYVAQAQRWQPQLRRRANEDHFALLAAFRNRDIEEAIAIQHRHVAVPIERTDPRRRRVTTSDVRASAGS